MACSITNVRARVDWSSFNASSGTASDIYVEGQASGCRANSLKVDVTRPDGSGVSNRGVPVNTAGRWRVQVKGSFRCDDRIQVVAVCSDDQTCQFVGTVVVECCPTQNDVTISVTWRLGNVTDAELEGSDCVAPGETYTFKVTSPVGAGFTYDWIITEGRQPGDPADVSGGGPSFDLPLPGDGIRRTVLVEVHAPGRCNPVFASRTLLDCGQRVCPTGFRWDPNQMRCVPACPSGTVWDPVKNQCVPDNTDGSGGKPGGSTTPGKKPGPVDTCPGLCWVVGFFLLAIPLSALLSGIAHCMLTPLGISIQVGFLMGVLFWMKRPLVCGPCCTYSWIVVGLILSVIATIVASYWLGPPECVPQAVAMAAGWVAAYLEIREECRNAGGSHSWFHF
jgi:hypothetical protein